MTIYYPSHFVYLAFSVLVVVGSISLILFAFNLLVRFYRSRRRQKERELIERWKRQLEELRAGNPVSTLKFPRDATSLVTVVSVWNRFTSEATPGELTRLRTYAREEGLMERVETVQNQLSASKRCVFIRALGLLGESRSWSLVASSLRAENLFLNIAAARALIRINAQRALPPVFEMIEQNPSIQPVQLEDLISSQDPELVTDSLKEAVKDHSPEVRYRLIPYFRFGKPEDSREWLTREVHSCWDNDEQVAQCLHALSHFEHLENMSLLSKCSERDFWPICLHTASCLGRVQCEDAVEVLKELLGDSEWWVRRHAAEALYKHDCVTDRQYQKLVETYRDDYGRDMLRDVRSDHETENVMSDD